MRQLDYLQVLLDLCLSKIIKKIGWLSLSDRRLFQKVVTMFKRKNGYAPDYLHNLLPPLVVEAPWSSG